MLSICRGLGLVLTHDFFSVPTDVTVLRGVPHGFRRYGNDLERASKKWDEVMSDGITWALSNPTAGPWEIKTD